MKTIIYIIEGLFKTLISAIGNHFILFFQYFCQYKPIFFLVETVLFYSDIFFLLLETGKSNFNKITLLLLVETDFVASGNHFFFHFHTLLPLLALFSCLVKTYFSNKYFVLSGGNQISG